MQSLGCGRQVELSLCLLVSCFACLACPWENWSPVEGCVSERWQCKGKLSNSIEHLSHQQSSTFPLLEAMNPTTSIAVHSEQWILGLSRRTPPGPSKGSAGFCSQQRTTETVACAQLSRKSDKIGLHSSHSDGTRRAEMIGLSKALHTNLRLGIILPIIPHFIRIRNSVNSPFLPPFSDYLQTNWQLDLRVSCRGSLFWRQSSDR